jgi:metal-sulfur cluster biosynthetic enzyme
MMWQFSEEQVLKKLRLVIDPELQINIVDLGLIYEVKFEEKWLVVRMTLTSPGCPLAPVITMMITEALADLPGFNADMLQLQLTFDPPWTPDMMTEEAKAELGMD